MIGYWTGKKRGHMSAEQKIKISEANKKFYSTHAHHQIGKPSPMIGRKHSLKTRALISRSQIGRKLSEEHKNKLRISSAGRKHSVESIKKLSLSRLGENNPAWKGGISKLPGYSNYNSKIRRQRLKGVPGSHTFQEWLLLKKQYGFKCPSCLIGEPEIILVKDHIIPIVKGGSNFIENIQPLCQKCNMTKFTKSTKYYFEVEIVK